MLTTLVFSGGWSGRWRFNFLHEIVIEMEPEDGVISVYGVGEEYTPAFTAVGIENLKQLIPMYREQVSRSDTTRS